MSRCLCRPDRRAFTLLETAISMVIIGVMLVAVLSTVAATYRTRRVGYDRPRAALLAHDLLAEILTKAYEEPFEVIEFGPEGGEGAAGRTAFDDIDDYHGWTRSPPAARDGTALTDPGWTRSVAVSFADPNDLASVSGGGDVGVKRITVKVAHDGRSLATLTTVRTRSWRGVTE